MGIQETEKRVFETDVVEVGPGAGLDQKPPAREVVHLRGDEVLWQLGGGVLQVVVDDVDDAPGPAVALAPAVDVVEVGPGAGLDGEDSGLGARGDEARQDDGGGLHGSCRCCCCRWTWVASKDWCRTSDFDPWSTRLASFVPM